MYGQLRCIELNTAYVGGGGGGGLCQVKHFEAVQ